MLAPVPVRPSLVGLSMSEQIHELLATAAGMVKGIVKDQKNAEQGFMFRSIDTITETAKPIFAELGISVTPILRSIEHHEVTSRGGARGYRCVVVMDYEIAGPDGSIRRAAMGGEAIDYGDKSTTKAEQMAFKYLLTEVLLIGSGGEDADASTHDLARPDPAALTPWQWFLGESKVFKGWTGDQVLAAAKEGFAQYAYTSATLTHDEARNVLEYVRNAYEAEPEQGALV